MTPAEFKSIRLRAGLTQRQLAERLRVSDHRTIRRYETGEREISGPVSLLMELIDRGIVHNDAASMRSALLLIEEKARDHQ